MKKNIEVEFRAMFSKSVYLRLHKFLLRYGKNLGKDDKDVFFYMFPDRLYKVVNNISKNNAKLVLKKNRIGRGSHFEEVEVPIERKYLTSAVALFDSLGAPKSDHEFQARQNFLWRGVEIALKYSGTWGYHAELEIVIHDPKQHHAAEEKINTIAHQLGIHIMTDHDLTVFLRRVENERRWRKK